MRSKLLQVKLVLDMMLICVLLFNSEVNTQIKVIIILLGFDYSMLCAERIDTLQKQERK